jgi:hypothetical protein
MKTHAVFSLAVAMAACASVAALIAAPLLAGTWLPEQRVTQSLPESYISHGNAHCLAGDSLGNMHLVWYQMQEDTGSVKWQILYKWFNGAVWGSATVLSEASNASHPSLVVEPGGIVHVVWAEGGTRIFYKKCDGVAWGTTEYLTPAGGEVYTPSLAQDGAGRLHLVWCDCRDNDDEIYYKVFDGAAWGPDTRLTEAAGMSWNPAVAVDPSGKIHVAWYDTRDGAAEIYYKVWDGAAWGPDTRLTLAGINAAQPAIAADLAGRVYVAWGDYRDGNNEIYVKVWDGAAWGPDTRLTYSGGTSWNPSLAVDDSCHVHLAWFDGRQGDPEIYYKEFDGVAWTADERLSNAAGPSENPSVAVSHDGSVHVAWQDDRDGNYEIYWTMRRGSGAPGIALTGVDHPAVYGGEVITLTIAGARLIDRTSVWLAKAGEPGIVGTSVVVTTPSGMRADFAIPSAARGAYDLIALDPGGSADTLLGAMTVGRGWHDMERLTNAAKESRTSKPGANCVGADSSGNVHVVWYDYRDGVYKIYYKKFDGAAWTADEVVSGSITNSMYPSIAVDRSGRVHVVWEAKPAGIPNWRIYYASSTGASWTTPERITLGSAHTMYPCIACDSQNRPHIVWQDGRNPGYSIYYKYNDGTAWSADLALASTGKDCNQPSIAIDSADNLHVVWNDYRNDNWEIYYKKRTGATWGADERLTDDPSESFGTDVAVDALGQVHVVWKGGASYAEIYYKMFDGVSWSPAMLLSDGLAKSCNPAVAVDGAGALHVVWQYKYSYGGNDEICYGSKAGATWWTGRWLTATSGLSVNPSIAADRLGRIHVVWSDLTLGHYEIYYKVWDPGLGTSGTPSDATVDWPAALGVYPNPARGNVTITFALGEAASPAIEIYDIAGRIVWRSALGARIPGRHQAIWDGRDLGGRPTGPGIYFLRLKLGGQSVSSKVVQLR